MERTYFHVFELREENKDQENWIFRSRENAKEKFKSLAEPLEKDEEYAIIDEPKRIYVRNKKAIIGMEEVEYDDPKEDK